MLTFAKRNAIKARDATAGRWLIFAAIGFVEIATLVRSLGIACISRIDFLALPTAAGKAIITGFSLTSHNQEHMSYDVERFDDGGVLPHRGRYVVVIIGTVPHRLRNKPT